jgi:Domain of unknown function (DUF4384)
MAKGSHEKAGSPARPRVEWVKYAFGIVGAVIGFLVGNWDKLVDIVFGTSIAVTMSNDLGQLNPSSKIEIRGLTSDSTQFNDDIALDVAARGIDVSPGVYSVSLARGKDVLATKNQAVSRGTNHKISFDRKSIEDAWRKQQKIDVRVELDGNTYAPGQPMGLQITVNGIGYLWIDQVDKSGNITGSYPPLDQEGSNTIGPTQIIVFPNEKKESFTAEVSPGEYRLIALVTSSAKRTDADKVFSEMVGAVTKGFGTLAANWGYAEAIYSVAAPKNH